MSTFERTLTLEKKVTHITIDPDGSVMFYGNATEVVTGDVMGAAQEDVTATLSSLQKRAVADLIATATTWLEQQTYPVVPEE